MTNRAVAARVRDEMALAKREFARRLRSAREAADKTQAEVAKQVGVDWATYQRWEVGRTSPRPGKIEAIARALDVEVEHLQGAEEDTDTALERLAAGVDSNSRALRELRVALDGILTAVAELSQVLERIEDIVTQQGDWARQALEAEDRIASGIARSQADQAAPPRSG